jgi:hypothetical protein
VRSCRVHEARESDVRTLDVRARISHVASSPGRKFSLLIVEADAYLDI